VEIACGGTGGKQCVVHGSKSAILDCFVEHVFDVMCMCDNRQTLGFCLTGQFFNAQHWLGWVAVKGFLLTRYT